MMIRAKLSRKFAIVKYIYAIALLAIAIALPRITRAQGLRDTVVYGCSTQHTVDIGEALQDSAYVSDTIVVIVGDTTLSTLNISRMSEDSHLNVSPDSGTAKVQGDTIQFVVFFHPDSVRSYSSTIILSQQGFKCPDTLHFVARGIDTSSQNDSVSLFAPLSHTIAFIAKQDSTVHHVRLYNDSLFSIDVGSIRMLYGRSFRVQLGSQPPYTVPAKGFFDVPLLFHNPHPGPNYDYLIVGAPDHPVLQDMVPLQGFFDPPPQFVKISVTRVAHFAVYPNPSHGEIMVHTESLTRTRAEIVDMLGRRIEEGSFNSDWQWNRETIGRGMAMSGAYFIVVSGMTESGESIREVETIVLE